MSQPLAGRNAIITGANQGLGLAIADAYVAAGASVLLCARDETLLEERPPVAGGEGSRRARSVEAERADVSSPADVARLAARALAIFPQVHVLVNNAGVYGPLGPSEDVDWDGLGARDGDQRLRLGAAVPRACCRTSSSTATERSFSSRAAAPPIRCPASAPTPRRRPRSFALPSRSRSRSRPFGIDVNAIAPGALNTRMLDEVVAAGPDAVGRDFYDRMVKTKEQGGTPLERGAALAVYLGSAASDGITGRLLSAVWDPWEDLAEPPRRSRRQRRLHAAPDRSEGPRLHVGGSLNRRPVWRSSAAA